MFPNFQSLFIFSITWNNFLLKIIHQEQYNTAFKCKELLYCYHCKTNTFYSKFKKKKKNTK